MELTGFLVFTAVQLFIISLALSWLYYEQVRISSKKRTGDL